MNGMTIYDIVRIERDLAVRGITRHRPPRPERVPRGRRRARRAHA